jgi:glycosyl transferase, family 25
MKKFKLDYEFIDAIDGRTNDLTKHPNYNNFIRMFLYKKPLISTEIACYLSHCKAYNKILNDNIKHAIVIEDDIILKPELFTIINMILKQNINFELIRFIGKKKIPSHKKIYNITDEYYVGQLYSSPGGAYCYLISNLGAKKMLNASKNIFCPIDTLMGFYFLTGIKKLMVFPSNLALENDDIKTEIGHKRFLLKKENKIIYIIGNLFFKIFLAIINFINYYF